MDNKITGATLAGYSHVSKSKDKNWVAGKGVYKQAKAESKTEEINEDMENWPRQASKKRSKKEAVKIRARKKKTKTDVNNIRI